MQNAMRDERRKELYILSLDSGRMFWVVVISLLTLVFLFLLGYWIGHDTVGAPPNDYARHNAGVGDIASRDGSTLRSELDRLGQGQLAMQSGRASVLPDDKARHAGMNEANPFVKIGEEEKPPIGSESLTTKTEKTEFETLRQSKPSVSTAPAQKTAAATAPKPVERKEVTAQRTPAAPAAGAQNTASGKYLVQVASLTSRASAESLVKTLEAKQYKANIMTTSVGGKDYFRVRVGGYDSYEAASRVVNNLHSSGDGSGCYIVQN